MPARGALLTGFVLLLLTALGGVAYAECRDDRPEVELGPPSVLIVMDASDSMAKDAGGGQTRLDAAKESLRTLVAGLPDDARVGLRLYGHRSAGVSRAEACRDTELVQPVAPLDRAALTERIDSYEAVGRTPIGSALREGADDLPDDGTRTSIVLVSDGGDNCAPPDPCEVAEDLGQEGTSVAIQAIGFQVTENAREQLECIAREGGGAYRDADDAGELAFALRALASRGLRDYEADGTPIEGGPQAAGAVPVESGRYLDAVAPDGERWYRVDLQRGQRLAAGATATGGCALGGAIASGGAIGAVLRIELFDERGEDLPGATQAAPNLFVGTELGFESVGVLDPTVPSPATRLVRVTVEDNGSGDLAALQDGEPLDVELLVDVSGEAGPAPSTPPPPAAGTPSRASDEEDTPTEGLAAVGLLGLLIGAGGGATVALRRWGGRS